MPLVTPTAPRRPPPGLPALRHQPYYLQAAPPAGPAERRALQQIVADIHPRACIGNSCRKGHSLRRPALQVRCRQIVQDSPADPRIPDIGVATAEDQAKAGQQPFVLRVRAGPALGKRRQQHSKRCQYFPGPLLRLFGIRKLATYSNGQVHNESLKGHGQLTKPPPGIIAADRLPTAVAQAGAATPTPDRLPRASRSRSPADDPRPHFSAFLSSQAFRFS
jgi:hypothetical protein